MLYLNMLVKPFVRCLISNSYHGAWGLYSVHQRHKVLQYADIGLAQMVSKMCTES